MAIAPPVRHEQHDAVTAPPRGVVEPPSAVPVEADQRLDPAVAAVQVGPLVGEAQVRLDYAAADRLEIDEAGVAGEVRATPRAAAVLDRAVGVRAHVPIIERAVAAGDAARMTPPLRDAIDQ